MNLLRHCLISMALCFILAGCVSDKFVVKDYFPEAKYPANTVGSYLNPIFKKMANDCNIVPSVPKDPEYSADFIAHEVRETLSVAKNTLAMTIPAAYTDWHPSMLFLYPFSASEKQFFINAVQNPTNGFPSLSVSFISENPAVNPTANNLRKDSIPQSMEGIPAMLYRQSCGSYARGGVKASVSFPVASLESALEKEYTNNSVVTLVTGYYESPLYRLYSEESPDGLFARLVLLNTYKRIQDIKAQSPDGPKPVDSFFQLMGYRGGFYKLGTISDRKTKVELSANAGGTYGVASGTVTATASFDSDAKYEEQDHGLLIWKVTSSDFAPLPSPEMILLKTKAAGRLASLVSQPATFMDNHEHVHKISISGLPKDLCLGNWAIEDVTQNVYSQGPTVKSSLGDQNNANVVPECIFQISGKAHSSATKNNGSVNISYTLKSEKNIVVASGVENIKIRIDNTDIIKFPASSLPRLSVDKIERQKITFDSTKVKYMWDALISSEDLAIDPIGYDKGHSIAITSINCPSTGLIMTKSDLKGEPGTRRLNLKLETIEELGDRDGWGEEMCKAQGTAHLTLASNVQVDRPIELAVKVPTKPPVSAALPVQSSGIIHENTRTFINKEDIFMLMK